MSVRKKLKLNGYYKMWLVIQMTKMKSLLSGVTHIFLTNILLLLSVSQFLLHVKGKQTIFLKSFSIWHHCFFAFWHIFRQTLQCSSLMSLFLCGSSLATMCVYGFSPNNIVNYLSIRTFFLKRPSLPTGIGMYTEHSIGNQ